MNNNIEVKLNDAGEIDHDYYVQKAYDLRAEYTGELIDSLSKKIKALLAKELPRFHIGSLAQH